MTKQRAYRIALSIIGLLYACVATMIIVGDLIGIDGLMEAGFTLLLTSIVWASVPLVTISDSRLPDPKAEREEEEYELHQAALRALHRELVGAHQSHDGLDEHQESLVRSLNEAKKRHYGRYRDWSW